MRLRLIRGLPLTLFFTFTLWTLSGSVISASDSAIQKVGFLDPKILELETLLQAKIEARADAFARDRKTLAWLKLAEICD